MIGHFHVVDVERMLALKPALVTHGRCVTILPVD
jgi:hypothetical protein